MEILWKISIVPLSWRLKLSNIKYYGNSKKSAPIISIENFYTNDELKLIWRELNFLNSGDKLKDIEEMGTAQDKDGNYLKKSKGVFLDHIFMDRSFSDILNINRKIFFPEFVEEISKKNLIFRYLSKCNRDSTLLSFYTEGGYYDNHEDSCCITAISYFFLEPKKFKGGDLFFSDFDIEIEIKNNMILIFPSCFTHAVSEITECKEEKYGRYSMTQFVSFAERT